MRWSVVVSLNGWIFCWGGKLGDTMKLGMFFLVKIYIYIYMDPKENIMGCFQILEI